MMMSIFNFVYRRLFTLAALAFSLGLLSRQYVFFDHEPTHLLDGNIFLKLMMLCMAVSAILFTLWLLKVATFLGIIKFEEKK